MGEKLSPIVRLSHSRPEYRRQSDITLSFFDTDSATWIVNFTSGGAIDRFYGDFRLGTHPTTHLTIGYQPLPTA
jgi:hypothetical protein